MMEKKIQNLPHKLFEKHKLNCGIQGSMIEMVKKNYLNGLKTSLLNMVIMAKNNKFDGFYCYKTDRDNMFLNARTGVKWRII